MNTATMKSKSLVKYSALFEETFSASSDLSIDKSWAIFDGICVVYLWRK